jgi:hypothetical protein
VSAHFDIHSAPRNQRHGPGYGVGGVRDPQYLAAIEKGLEDLYNTLVNPPFSRRPPAGNPTWQDRTLVEVLEVQNRFPDCDCPHTRNEERVAIPCIVLPCRTTLPTLPAELEYITVAAAHEATHVFNWVERPPKNRLLFEAWRWFNEATAVFMERVAFPAFHNYLEYSLDWCDRPELSLDSFVGQYGTAMFVRYLAGRWGREFVSEVWMKAEEGEKPLEMIERLKGVPGQQRCQCFASYALDAYFLADPNSHCHAPDVHQRYGGRALQESFDLSARRKRPLLNSAVPHLACHYYRFYPPPGKPIGFQWNTGADLDMTAAVADARLCRGQMVSLQPNEPKMLTADDADHVVLVVSNPAFSGGPKRYSIQVL